MTVNEQPSETGSTFGDGAKGFSSPNRCSRRRFLAFSTAGAAAVGAASQADLGASKSSGEFVPSSSAPSSSGEDEDEEEGEDKEEDVEFVDQPTPARYFIRRENGSYEVKQGPVGAAVLGGPNPRHGDMIPNGQSFIHNRSGPPAIDVETWGLGLTGDALAQARSFTYAELLAMPQVTLRRTLDYGANCASFFPKLPPFPSSRRPGLTAGGCRRASPSGTSVR